MLTQLNKYKIELADTLTGHWYKISLKKRVLGYYPSSTTILNAYPQSVHLTQWIAEKGWHESQRIKSEAGIKGTNVHEGIQKLIDGNELNRLQYSLEEWYLLVSFKKWWDEYKPQILFRELPIFSRKYKYAGKADTIFEINGKRYVADWKTSGTIYDHFPLQVSSYAQAIEETYKIKINETAIVQFGAKNKLGYRFVLYPEWREHFIIFQNVRKVWEYDNSITKDYEPSILNLPSTLKL